MASELTMEDIRDIRRGTDFSDFIIHERHEEFKKEHPAGMTLEQFNDLLKKERFSEGRADFTEELKQVIIKLFPQKNLKKPLTFKEYMLVKEDLKRCFQPASAQISST